MVIARNRRRLPAAGSRFPSQLVTVDAPLESDVEAADLAETIATPRENKRIGRVLSPAAIVERVSLVTLTVLSSTPDGARAWGSRRGPPLRRSASARGPGFGFLVARGRSSPPPSEHVMTEPNKPIAVVASGLWRVELYAIDRTELHHHAAFRLLILDAHDRVRGMVVLRSQSALDLSAALESAALGRIVEPPTGPVVRVLGPPPRGRVAP